jgi:hypothetical protein
MDSSRAHQRTETVICGKLSMPRPVLDTAFSNRPTQRYRGVGCVPFQPVELPVPLVPRYHNRYHGTGCSVGMKEREPAQTAYWGLASKVEIEIYSVESLHTLVACPIASEPRCRQNPALYHRFKHSVASMIFSPSLFRAEEIVSFASLKIRSVSALIAGINSILNTIGASCVKPEFAYYLKRLALSASVISEPLK